MELDVRDKVVIVTGAGRGIGHRVAERFVAEGGRVAALDLAFDEPGVEGADSIQVDVSDPESVSTATARVIERFGRVDVLINNAGINVEGEIESLDHERWRRGFAVNVDGVFLMSQAVIPVMKRQRSGRIINAASFAAIIPGYRSAAYAASKAAVVQFTRVLASELGPWGITANAYAPGMVPTAMNGFADLDDQGQQTMLDMLSLRRWGTPDDIADLLLFLASDASSYITGTLVDVSGGKFATQAPWRAHRAVG